MKIFVKQLIYGVTIEYKQKNYMVMEILLIHSKPSHGDLGVEDTLDMDPAVASIIVAVIGVFGTLAGIAIKEFKSMKKTNSLDHGQVMQQLNKVQSSVDKVGDRLNDHIDWHVEKK